MCAIHNHTSCGQEMLSSVNFPNKRNKQFRIKWATSVSQSKRIVRVDMADHHRPQSIDFHYHNPRTNFSMATNNFPLFHLSDEQFVLKVYVSACHFLFRVLFLLEPFFLNLLKRIQPTSASYSKSIKIITRHKIMQVHKFSFALYYFLDLLSRFY